MIPQIIRRGAVMTSMATVLALAGIGTATVTSSLVPAPAAAAAQQTRFGQPTLYTDDIDAMSRFYVALGFTELFRFPESGTQFATLRKGDFFLTMATYGAIRDATGISRIVPAPVHSGDVTLLTSDVDGMYAAALGAGGVSQMTPRNQPFGERQAFVTDPSGHLVGISTENGGGGTG